MKRRSLIKELYLLCVLFTLSSAQSVRLVKPGKIPKDGDCVYVTDLPSDQQCSYLNRESDPCEAAEGFFFNYSKIIYCRGYNLYGVLVAFAVVVINLFLMVGLTADGFFCPALAVIAVKLGMSENLAGVSLVAFGNGAPDLFTSISGLAGDPNVELVYSQLMGGGLFVTLFVVGIICITAPFRVEGKLFIRDCLFYIAAVIWAFMVLRNSRVYLWQAIVFLTIYGVYVIVVLLSGSKAKSKESMESRLNIQQIMMDHRRITFDPKEHMYMQMVTKIQCGRLKKTAGLETEVIIIQHGLLKEFLQSIWPFEGWEEMDILRKIICIWKAPYKIFLCLIIPVVDYDAPKHGWCKVLNIVNVFLLPIYINIVTGTGNYHPIGGVPMILITFLLSISLAVFVGLTSLQMEPPTYHSAIFAPLAFIGSVVTVYATANEVVAVINAIGITVGATPTTLGCTFLAWGNSIGDFVTIYGLAKKGYPRMAFAGVYGGTIFNILLSLGSAALFATVSNGREGKGYFFASDIGTLGANMLMYMLSGLVSCIIMLPVMGFQARKSYGKYLLIIYALFNVNILLNEFDLIHPLERVYLQQITYPNGTLVYKDIEVIFK